MADNKKYYYLKLKEDFFESEELKLLQAMPDGYLFSDILLKLYLKSLKEDGRLMYKGIIPYTSTMIATLTNHQVGTVEKAVETLKGLHLLDVLDNGAIYMLDIQNFIGEGSTEADRVREYRRRIKQEKAFEKLDVTNVMQSVHDSYLENRDKSIDINISKDILSSKDSTTDDFSEVIKKVIQYLNEKTGKSYKWNTPNTQKHIRARFREKYSYADFVKVIDTKVSDWKHDKRMSKYLRPDTLFGAKFESYLNERGNHKGESNDDLFTKV